MKTNTLPELKSPKTSSIQRHIEARLKALNHEETQLKSLLEIYHSGDTRVGKSSEQENQGRFRSADLLPVLRTMKKDFTLDDLLARAHKKELDVTKTQIYSALNALHAVVRIVVPGVGRRVAVYRYTGQ